jgi:hypothetical protein
VIEKKVEEGKDISFSEECFAIFLDGAYYLFIGMKYKR